MDATSATKRQTLEVSLSNGTIVDIATKEGVNAFLIGVSSFNHFSSNLKEIRKLRKKKRLNARDDKKLKELLEFIGYFARLADREIFRAKIPESEIQELLNFFIEELTSLARKPSWINSGYFDDRDQAVFLCCASMFGGGHVVPFRLALKSDFFQVLANSIRVMRGCLPHFFFCGFVVLVTEGSLNTAQHSSDNCWTTAKIFKKFEASGLLEQILRCSTVPVPPADIFFDYSHLLRGLESCAGLLTSKLKVGTPCGNTLKAILDGRDGSGNVRPKILNRLKNIARLVEAMDPTEIKICVFNHCQNCAVSEAPLFSCSGCRLAHYCSKECHRADWKRHKGVCRSFSTPEKNMKLSLRAASWRFLKRNSEIVFQEIERMCESTGVEASNLVVVVSLVPDEDGIIQGLQDPPVFEVLERAFLSNLFMIEPHASMVLLYFGFAHCEDTIIETFRQGGYRQGLKLEDYLCD